MTSPKSSKIRPLTTPIAAPRTFTERQTPKSNLALQPAYGVLSRKKRSGSERSIEMLLEKLPLPSNVPVVLVVHSARGVARLVAVNQAKPAPAVPPEPARIKLPPETVLEVIVGPFGGEDCDGVPNT